MSERVLILLVLVIAFCALRTEGQSFFSPVWHTPNSNNKDGTPCSTLRPDRTVNCPTFCISIEDLCAGDCPENEPDCCQKEVEARCLEFGDLNCNDDTEDPDACDKMLMPDGSWSTCELMFGPLWEPVYGDGTLTCISPTGEEKSIDNACDCGGHPAFVSDNGGTKYRSCRNDLPTEVEHYYGGSDFDGELTKEYCSHERGTDDDYTCVDTKAKGGCIEEGDGCSDVNGCTFYPFPLIYLEDSDLNPEYGFLECPQASRADEGYFTTWGWIMTYCVYGVGAIFVCCYALYKYLRERNSDYTREVGGHVASSASTSSMDDKSSTAGSTATARTAGTTRTVAMGNVEIGGESGTTQTGIANDWFGFFNFWYLVFMSLYMFVFICVECADIYGVIWWACPDVMDYMDSGGDCPYSWREGLTCAALCVFTTIPTKGSLTYWPYWNIPPGHPRYQQIFIVSWHVAVFWFFVLVALKDHLRPWYRIKAPLDTCKYVQVIQPQQDAIVLQDDQDSTIGKMHKAIANAKQKVLGPPMIKETVKVNSDEGGNRYFDFRCQRYCWNETAQMFVAASVNAGWTHEQISTSAGGLTSQMAAERCQIVGENAIRVPVPSWAAASFDAMMDYFFLYQMSGIMMAFHFWYYVFGFVIFLMALYGVGVKVWSKRSSLKRIKVIAEASADIDVLRDGVWKVMNSECLVPGDACRLIPGPVSCDMALVKGRVVVDESSLTGEPNPVPKISLEPIPKPYTKQGEDAKFTVYSGTTIQAVSSSKDEAVLGVVVSTGAETNKGKLVRGILFPAPIEFKFNQHWTVVFGLLLCEAVIGAVITFYFINWKLDGWFYAIFLVLKLISPLLPSTFILAQTKAVSKLKKSDIHCVHPQRTIVSAKVKVACFDKTGTLTESGLHYAGVIPIKDGKFTSEVSATVSHAIGCCHELDLVETTGCKVDERDLLDGKLCVGNEVDKRMFFGSGYGFSPIEPLTFCSPDGTALKTLRRFEFDRATMTMTTIVEDQSTKERHVFCKGNPDYVSTHCLSESLPDDWASITKARGSEGFYVLGLAHKKYDGPEDVSQVPRVDVEKRFSALGLLQFRNSLKEETADVMAEVKGGSIRPVMITGDAAETGLRIARECGLSTARRVFIASVSKLSKKDVGLTADMVIWSDALTGEPVPDLFEHLEDMEEGKIELLVTGKTFDILCNLPVEHDRVFRRLSTRVMNESDSEKFEEHLPESKMDDILRYTRIFARMKPEQKSETIRMHMKNSTTSMCGDGANDAAALQRSHAGVALASGGGGDEAALVAHFATPGESLRTYVSVIAEGRAALATMLHAYKFLIAYGQITAFLGLISYYFAYNMCEAGWITVDIIINVGYIFAIMQGQKSGKRLSAYRPTSSLFGPEIMTSLISHTSVNLCVMIFLTAIMYTQDWYLCKELDGNLIDLGKWWLKGDNYEAGMMTTICLFMWSSSAAVFNFGFDYRRAWIKNWLVPVYWIILMTAWSASILSGPNGWGCLYHTNCGDNTMLKQWSDEELTNNTDLGFTGWGSPYSHPEGGIKLAPEGCSCEDTIDPEDITCQAEYESCDKVHFNQVYHHNIFPKDYRLFLWGIILLGIIVNFCVEGILIVGPLRTSLRKRRDKNITEKEWRRRVIVGGPMEEDDPFLQSKASDSEEEVAWASPKKKQEEEENEGTAADLTSEDEAEIDGGEEEMEDGET